MTLARHRLKSIASAAGAAFAVFSVAALPSAADSTAFVGLGALIGARQGPRRGKRAFRSVAVCADSISQEFDLQRPLLIIVLPIAVPQWK